jgi:hypothetical protein
MAMLRLAVPFLRLGQAIPDSQSDTLLELIRQ